MEFPNRADAWFLDEFVVSQTGELLQDPRARLLYKSKAVERRGCIAPFGAGRACPSDVVLIPADQEDLDRRVVLQWRGAATEEIGRR